MDEGSERSRPSDLEIRERAQRRARLLDELNEARELLERVAPRRAAAARRRAALRALTFRR
ncbi:MAG TPA: hypothetical protein VE081_04595 [Sporichthyaceae bacterium]|nr:hypothetical protein [Sporichthyaceae bacterium]